MKYSGKNEIAVALNVQLVLLQVLANIFEILIAQRLKYEDLCFKNVFGFAIVWDISWITIDAKESQVFYKNKIVRTRFLKQL